MLILKRGGLTMEDHFLLLAAFDKNGGARTSVWGT